MFDSLRLSITRALLAFLIASDALISALIVPRAAAHAESPATTDEIVLHFPKNRSLGDLQIYIPNDKNSWRSINAMGEVRMLKLAQAGLMVSQPACQDLSQLAQPVKEGLNSLYFRDVELDAAAIDQIASLEGVKSLDFMSCNLTQRDWQKLSQLTSLTSLSLFQVPITDEGLATLESLAKLEQLDLYGTKLTNQALKTIVKFKSLKHLRLGDKVTGEASFDYLKDLPALEYLMFDNVSEISDAAMAQLAGLRHLEVLNLLGRNTKISDAGVAELGKLQHLKTLDLSNTTVSDEGMERLPPLKSLTEFRLPPRITDRGLARIGEFNSLTNITCMGGDVTDAGVAEISKLPHIEFLNLSGSGVTDRGMQDLAKATTLEGLFLQHCKVGDAGLEALAPLKSLKWLLISSTSITAEGIRHLQQFPALENLVLQDLAGETADMRQLRFLVNLKRLKLGSPNRRGAKWNEADLDFLVEMKHLTQLELADFPVTDAGVKRLLAVPSLENVQINPTKSGLTDAALAYFAEMKNLKSLSVSGKFTDSGLGLLATSRSLGSLTISSHTLSEGAVAQLRKSMTVSAPLFAASAKERAAKFFAVREDLRAALASAKTEARREHTRVLLVLGDAESDLSKKLVQLFDQPEVSEVMGNFERVSVTGQDRETVAELLSLPTDALKATPVPALIVLDDDGRPLLGRTFTIDANAAYVDPASAIEFLNGHAPQLDAEAILAAALDRAKRENKRVFLKQTGAYCGPCRTMSKFLENHSTFFDSQYVCITIDSVRFKNGRAVTHRYRPLGGLIPWVAILDADGKALITSDSADGPIGFPSDAKGIDHFMHMLSTTARQPTPEAMQQIRGALEKRLAPESP